MGPVRPVSGGKVAGPRAARRGGAFSVPGDAQAAPVSVPSAPGALGGLLALQESLAPEPAESRARRRASAALRELTGMQFELLGGEADPARLGRLLTLAEAEAEGAEPALASILRDIALRARIELARRRVGSRV